MSDMIRRIRKYRTHKNAVKKKKNYIQKIQIPNEEVLIEPFPPYASGLCFFDPEVNIKFDDDKMDLTAL